MSAAMSRRASRSYHGKPVLHLWFSLSPVSKRLIASGAALLLMMVAAVGVMMWNMRSVAQNDARQNVGTLGIALAEQTSRSFQAVDLVLQDLQQDFVRDGVGTPEAFRTNLHTQALQITLRQKDEALPQASAFTIIDSNGKLVNFSRQWPIPPTDLSDRDYYKYFRDHDDPEPYVSVPVQNRGNGDWTLYIVRRVNGPTGSFLGMVLGAIDLTYFRDFYKALTVGAGTTVTLLQRDGTALTSFPTTAVIGAKLPATSPWHDIVARRHPDILVTQGVLAPGQRLVSVHPLLDYPLVVNVSISEWDSLGNWRSASLLGAIGTGCAVLCTILLLRTLIVQLQRLERSEESLEERNALLETAGDRLKRQAAELQASQDHLAEKSAALGTTLGHMNQGIMMVDPGGTVAVYNAKLLEMLDLPATLLESRPTFASLIAYQHSINEFKNDSAIGLGTREELSGQPSTYARTRPTGSILELQSVPLMAGGMVRTYTDITERRTSEERIRYFAHHDGLTKLVNRVVFQERLEDAIELADRTGRSVAVLYLDLDRFKIVNDTRGHSVGDKMLVQVAERLLETVRQSDTVARMGGDEFAIIQPLIEQPGSSTALAERILNSIKRPFEIDGSTCSVGMSIGIALYPNQATNANDLLRNADTALYRAKSGGRNTCCIFDELMDARQQQLVGLEQELRQALDVNQFELAYQPIINTDFQRAVCFEALLRWRHPERGMIAPADFIGLAEKSGLILPIGLWVLETACSEAANWPTNVQIAVNLSPLQFNQQSLVDELTEILERTGLSPCRLILEVTEGLLLQETSVVLDTMSRLRSLGIRFSLDDFGTAHSGLSYLRRFPFDTIKIDKSFVQDMVDQPGARAIVVAVLAMGAALNLGVIAEGVETEEQLDALRKLNCVQVQGYLLGRPGTSVEARKNIARSQSVPA